MILNMTHYTQSGYTIEFIWGSALQIQELKKRLGKSLHILSASIRNTNDEPSPMSSPNDEFFSSSLRRPSVNAPEWSVTAMKTWRKLLIEVKLSQRVKKVLESDLLFPDYLRVELLHITIIHNPWCAHCTKEKQVHVHRDVGTWEHRFRQMSTSFPKCRSRQFTCNSGLLATPQGAKLKKEHGEIFFAHCLVCHQFFLSAGWRRDGAWSKWWLQATGMDLFILFVESLHPCAAFANLGKCQKSKHGISACCSGCTSSLQSPTALSIARSSENSCRSWQWLQKNPAAFELQTAV